MINKQMSRFSDGLRFVLCMRELCLMQPVLPEFAHKELVSAEGQRPAASELTEQRPWFNIYTNSTKITSTCCARDWDKWGKCAVRMGLIYAQSYDAKLEDIAALLLCHKNDRKWDNDVDLQGLVVVQSSEACVIIR